MVKRLIHAPLRTVYDYQLQPPAMTDVVPGTLGIPGAVTRPPPHQPRSVIVVCSLFYVMYNVFIPKFQVQHFFNPNPSLVYYILVERRNEVV
jgi:hypothetical protein